MKRRAQETIDVLGRIFVLVIDDSARAGRCEARIYEGPRRRPWQRPYLKAPIRGRDADEARERALHVLHNYVGLDQFRLIVEAAAREAAPGASVEISEDARAVTVRLTGAYRLRQPLAVPRDQVLAPSAEHGRLRSSVLAHLKTHSEPTTTTRR